MDNKKFKEKTEIFLNAYMEGRLKREKVFFDNLKKSMPELKKLLEEIIGHWTYEDLIYRFYHQSFKVYHLQGYTIQIIDALKKLFPEECKINPFFEEIYKEGTGKTFSFDHNEEWLKHTRPIVEAFLHAKYFLEMAVKYGEELESPVQCLPSGWAGLLYLPNLR